MQVSLERGFIVLYYHFGLPKRRFLEGLCDQNSHATRLRHLLLRACHETLSTSATCSEQPDLLPSGVVVVDTSLTSYRLFTYCQLNLSLTTISVHAIVIATKWLLAQAIQRPYGICTVRWDLAYFKTQYRHPLIPYSSSAGGMALSACNISRPSERIHHIFLI